MTCGQRGWRACSAGLLAVLGHFFKDRKARRERAVLRGAQYVVDFTYKSCA
jgi:hypothetical protein